MTIEDNLRANRICWDEEELNSRQTKEPSVFLDKCVDSQGRDSKLTFNKNSLDICKYNSSCRIRRIIKRKDYCSLTESKQCMVYKFNEKWGNWKE